MSTTDIRAALDAAGMAAPDTGNEDLARKVAAAWIQLEAIEKAAGVVVDATADLLCADRLDEWQQGIDTLRAIATQRSGGTAGAPSTAGASGPQE